MNGLTRNWLIGGGIGLASASVLIFGFHQWLAAIAAMWLPFIVATVMAFAAQDRRINELLPACSHCDGAMTGDGMYGYYCSVCGLEFGRTADGQETA